MDWFIYATPVCLLPARYHITNSYASYQLLNGSAIGSEEEAKYAPAPEINCTLSSYFDTTY
jgi:hypothetical protein